MFKLLNFLNSLTWLYLYPHVIDVSCTNDVVLPVNTLPSSIIEPFKWSMSESPTLAGANAIEPSHDLTWQLNLLSRFFIGFDLDRLYLIERNKCKINNCLAKAAAATTTMHLLWAHIAENNRLKDNQCDAGHHSDLYIDEPHISRFGSGTALDYTMKTADTSTLNTIQYYTR